MTVGAIVCAYYPERFANVRRSVADLYAGSCTPDHVIVLNNNPDHPDAFDEIEGPTLHHLKAWNTGTRGKYVAALLHYSDYYLLLDDDITVGPRTLETLLSYTVDPQYADLVAANRGARLIPGLPFSKAALVNADATGGRVWPADTIHGICAFMSHQAMARMIAAEQPVRSKWPVEGDDILAGLASPGRCWTLPLEGESAFTLLDPCGVGMCEYLENYFPMRDAFTHDFLESRQ